MRVPGFILSSCGRSLKLRSGSRYSVTTVASVKSFSKMSPAMIFTLSETPARAALRTASAAMSGLNSMPTARALKSRAAAIGILPSPAPRSYTMSLSVVLAARSMRATSASGVGTQTTFLPDWPTCGR